MELTLLPANENKRQPLAKGCALGTGQHNPNGASTKGVMELAKPLGLQFVVCAGAIHMIGMPCTCPQYLYPSLATKHKL